MQSNTRCAAGYYKTEDFEVEKRRQQLSSEHDSNGNPVYHNGSWNAPCTHCSPCPASTYRVLCGNASAGECWYCPVGSYMNDTYLWDTPCFSCQPCPAGSHRVGCRGASSRIQRERPLGTAAAHGPCLPGLARLALGGIPH